MHEELAFDDAVSYTQRGNALQLNVIAVTGIHTPRSYPAFIPRVLTNWAISPPPSAMWWLRHLLYWVDLFAGKIERAWNCDFQIQNYWSFVCLTNPSTKSNIGYVSVCVWGGGSYNGQIYLTKEITFPTGKRGHTVMLRSQVVYDQ